MNLPVADQPRPPEKPTASTRFQFATGDRPLSGYTIKRGVGRGGFGEVYFAVSDGGKEVALKLIRRNLDVELRGVQHCLNLKHPNLIALYDIRRDGDDDDCWIVMEYVAGESLEGAIRRHPQGMPADEAVQWLRGIAAGASYLHSHGIVHRDLKPGNVFRDESLVKLGDYGLSKFISCSRRSGQTESVGTVHYMAPEIAHGRYGREIDIYALGVILYEMLTGRVPFDGESVGEVLMKHLTAQPDVSLVPAAYRQVVARALAKDPAVRFGSIEQFLAALPGAGPGPAAAAPNPTAAAAVGPEVHQSRNAAAPRAPLPAPQAAFDPVPPAAVLWALGTVAVFLALSPAIAAELSPAGRPTLVGWMVYAALIGAPVFFLARSRARWKAGPLPGNQHWPASSDVPPPLPPMPAGRGSTGPPAAPRLARRTPLDQLAGLHPAAVGVIGAVCSIMSVLFLGTVVSKGSGGPSSLLLIGTGLLGGWASHSWVKKRARRQTDAPRGSTSEFPVPLPTGGQAALDPGANAWGPAGGFPPPVAGIIGAVLAGLALPLYVASRGERGPSSLVVIGLALLGGFAAYSWAKSRARQRSASQQRTTSSGQRPLSSADAPPPSTFRSAAYSMGRAAGMGAERATPALVVKSPRERLAELLESLLVSAAVSMVLAVVAAAWQRGESGAEEVAWFALTSSLGAWGVLVLSKLWEGTHGEPILRRFAMLVVGLGLGAGSFGLDQLLMVRLPFQNSIRPAPWHVDWDFYNRLDGAPHLEAYLAYFGLMFFLIPWWRQADPLRPSRMSFGSLAWTLIVAWSLQLICPFPQPWGTIVATIISLSVQLATPPAAKANRLATGGKNV